jgi:hypothetical protein
MTLVILSLALLLFAWTLVQVFRAIRGDVPLPRREVDSPLIRDIEQLARRKRRLLSTIKRAEFDFETNKISEADYERLRSQATKSAVAVMRQLDDARGKLAHPERVAADLAAVEAEHANAAASSSELVGGGAQIVSFDSALHSPTGGSAAARMRRKLRAREGTCPECDAPRLAADRFCSDCGAGLTDRCRACDAPLRAGAIFCRSCGETVSTESEERA